ncbi:hypothetical protein FRC10_009496 [Ceratobasidium sp. 414]|nr:hypothetical protein FRC10_009496 [Ceratobasidium sp. 414]
MSDIRLRPIIIAPIAVGQFTCLGDGLLYEGVEREQPDKLLDLLVPVKTSGQKPIEDRGRPKKWWKALAEMRLVLLAQCAHYGINIPPSAPIDTYRKYLENAILRHGELKVPRDLADLESWLNTKFRRRNARERAKRERTGATPFTPEPKAGTKNESVDSGAGSVATKTTTSPKRKAEDIVHARGHDEDELQSSGAPADLEQGAVRRAKQPRHAFDHPSSYSRPPSLQPSSLQTVVHGGTPSACGEIYRLECTSSVNTPSQGTPVLNVFGFLFEALLEIPGFKFLFRIKSNARLGNNSYVPCERYHRNEWGMEVRSPVSENAGWLTLYDVGGQVKGVIQTPSGKISFQGSRVMV